MEFPDDLKYTKEHEWVRLNGDTAIIGITAFAQDELGDIVFVEVPKVGRTLDQNETFGVVESVKTVSDLFSPLSGEVVEVNAALESTPELVNTDSYGEGWMIKLKTGSTAELDGLLSASDYKTMIGK